MWILLTEKVMTKFHWFLLVLSWSFVPIAIFMDRKQKEKYKRWEKEDAEMVEKWAREQMEEIEKRKP
jgi:hypothetical protein